VKLAAAYDGEIICADSRTIYKDMNIGTAKPTAQERATVPHWGLDLVAPGESFTAADFKTYASAKNDEIRSRGRIPFLVGGSGLYIDSVVFDYQFAPKADPTKRQQLEALTIDQLHDYCDKNNIELPENRRNKRYVIRKIEQKDHTPKRRSSPISTSIIVGIATDKDELRRRIHERAEHILENGVVQEAILLGKKYGWESAAMSGNVYPLVRLYLNEQITYNEMKEKFTTSDWRLAKRQITWLKRNAFIQWYDLPEAEHFLSQTLASLKKP
jgi:tRNA dimethylallyltransferase